jgi:hypothetical protein
MFTVVLKNRLGLMTAALGTNPFFGFLGIRQNQPFKLVFAVWAFYKIDGHRFLSHLVAKQGVHMLFCAHTKFGDNKRCIRWRL